MGKFNQVANLVSPSVSTSNTRSSVSRPNCTSHAADWVSDAMWGFPLAAVSVTTVGLSIRNVTAEITSLPISPQPVCKTDPSQHEKNLELLEHISSQVPAALSLVIKVLQDIWAHCVSSNAIMSSNSDNIINITVDSSQREVIHQFCVCTSRSLHRTVPFILTLPNTNLFMPDTLLPLVMKVLLLDSLEVFSLSQRTKMLITLEVILR